LKWCWTESSGKEKKLLRLKSLVKLLLVLFFLNIPPVITVAHHVCKSIFKLLLEFVNLSVQQPMHFLITSDTSTKYDLLCTWPTTCRLLAPDYLSANEMFYMDPQAGGLEIVPPRLDIYYNSTAWGANNVTPQADGLENRPPGRWPVKSCPEP